MRAVDELKLYKDFIQDHLVWIDSWEDDVIDDLEILSKKGADYTTPIIKTQLETIRIYKSHFKSKLRALEELADAL